MKSLAERTAFREKQKANEAKERETSPLTQKTGEERKQTEEEKFDAKDWLNDSVENIVANLSDLSNEELSSIEQAEAAGKKRTGVTSAIKKEKDKRTEAGVNWTPNNA